MVAWIVESYDDDVRNLGLTLSKLNVPWKYVGYIPLQSDITKNWMGLEGKRFYYGSVQGVNCVQRKYPDISTIASFDNFTYLYTDAFLSYYLLNEDYFARPIGSLRFDDFMDAMCYAQDIFIRPNSGKKVFPGQLLHSKNTFSDLIDTWNLQPTDVVIVNFKPSKIQREWRLVIDNTINDHTLCHTRSVICSSQYKKDGELFLEAGAPAEVISYAETVLSDCPDYDPDPFFTLDIGEVNGKLYVIEANALSCSGLYACELDPLIEKVNSYYEE